MSKSSNNASLGFAIGAVALLAGSAYYVYKKSAQAEADNPPKGRFIEVDGVKLHYTEHGDPQAPALVMLHGVGAMGEEMALSGLVERAASQFRVLVFDRPGYGHSERPSGRSYTPQAQGRLILHALTQLDVERPVVLAHSWATLIAMSMADQAPHALKGLVLLGGYYTPSARLDVLFNSLPAIPVLGHLMAHTVSPLIARALWGASLWRIFSPAPKAVRESFDQRYPKWMTLRPKSLRATAAETAMLIPQSVLLRSLQARLSLPVVLVAGEQDRLLMTRWHSERLQDRLPNARLHVVPGGGHMLHHTAPEAVFDAIREVATLVTHSAPIDMTDSRFVSPEDVALQAGA